MRIEASSFLYGLNLRRCYVARKHERVETSERTNEEVCYLLAVKVLVKVFFLFDGIQLEA